VNKILGINYSGFHDTAITLIDENGKIEKALSLERISREKQDGRMPYKLLELINLDEVTDIVISSNKEFVKKEYKSILHPEELKPKRDLVFEHHNEFYNFIDSIDSINISYVDHELSHAASAFYLSNYNEAICLVYDGGMYNSNTFGGVYKCSLDEGISLVDGFDINKYAKITTLYTVITAMLGFTPNKHEGKITGLAAYGKYDKKCTNLLNDWFVNRYNELETSLEWIFSYSKDVNPIFHKKKQKLFSIKESFKEFDKETIAYNLQLFTENHILKIIDNMKINNLLHKNICLAGGLFANVKINQKIAEYNDYKFENVFIAPPMGDEGTALGAACIKANKKYNIRKFNNSMYLGFEYCENDIKRTLTELNVNYKILKNPSNEIAEILATGDEVALFDLKMEFGPRALGSRSILAPANDKTINERLNQKLNRTEFMPFAPMTLEEFLDKSYINFKNKKDAMKFMTISCECTVWMKNNMPAVVHIDNTARPQVITKKNEFLYELMHNYNKLTNLSSIVNTSFNIHEEPIINTPYEAIKGFLISGLQYLFFKEANILLKYDDNRDLAFKFVKERMLLHKPKEEQYKRLSEYFEEKSSEFYHEMSNKEKVIQELKLFEDNLKEQIRFYDNNKFVKLLKKLGLIR